jgi:MazG family protein
VTVAEEAAERAAEAFARLVSVMATLRAPGGCPWDARQTHASLAIHLLEEAHETLDAIDRGDAGQLEEELGDLLLQIVFHAEIARGEGHFEIADVVDALVDKLVRRHPHVFGDAVAETADDVVVQWETLKHEQKGRADIAEGIPRALPALLLAHKVQRRLAGQNARFEASAERISEMASSLKEAPDAGETVGALLYEVVALAQSAGVDPEGVLRRHATRALAHR